MFLKGSKLQNCGSTKLAIMPTSLAHKSEIFSSKRHGITKSGFLAKKIGVQSSLATNPKTESFQIICNFWS